MSEKELRAYADHKIGCHISAVGEYDPEDGQKVPCSCGFEQILADEPDVVRLALELLESETVESSSGERYISLPVERLRELLGAMFGIRLTETGWEWTE